MSELEDKPCEGRRIEITLTPLGILWAIVSIPFLLLHYLAEWLVMSAVGAFDYLLVGFCNALGRAGVHEVGGALLQLRHPKMRVTWLPDGIPLDEIQMLEKVGLKVPAKSRKPHFSVDYFFIVE